MRSKRFWCGLGAAAFLLVVSGCPGRNTDGKLRVAFVTNNVHTFWTIAEKGTQKAAAREGVDAEFRMPSKGSKEEQQQIIEDLVRTGIKGLAVSPNDAANSVDFFKHINAKIPVVMQDSDLPDPTARRCYIGTDNYKAGLAVGELVAKAAPKGGKIAIFVGKLDVQNAQERRQGVIDYLADPKAQRKQMGERTPNDAANVKLGSYVLVTTITDNTEASACQERAEELLLTHPDLVCLIGLWAYNPPALVLAVRSSKAKAKPLVVGFDENADTLEAIKTGECYATVVQNPYEFGYQSVVILTGLAKGNNAVLKHLTDSTTKAPLTIDADNRIFIPHRVITKDNVEAFSAELKKLTGK